MLRIVITGAPGAGKTTLLHALERRGYPIVGDSFRTIIQDRRRRGLSPRPDPMTFAQTALQMDVDNFARFADGAGPVFFERSILDALCEVNRVAPLSEPELRTWVTTYRYFPTVFVLPPWETIYVTDEERDHTFAHAQSVDRTVRAWYERCGYAVVDVPMASVDERCRFVLETIGASS